MYAFITTFWLIETLLVSPKVSSVRLLVQCRFTQGNKFYNWAYLRKSKFIYARMFHFFVETSTRFLGTCHFISTKVLDRGRLRHDDYNMLLFLVFGHQNSTQDLTIWHLCLSWQLWIEWFNMWTIWGVKWINSYANVPLASIFSLLQLTFFHVSDSLHPCRLFHDNGRIRRKNREKN